LLGSPSNPLPYFYFGGKRATFGCEQASHFCEALAPFLKGLLGFGRVDKGAFPALIFFLRNGLKWTRREKQKLVFVSETENNFSSLGVKHLSF